MKKNLLLLAAVVIPYLLGSVQAQTATSAVTGATYADNVWYSLENGTVKTESATNWDIAFGAASSQFSSLSASVHFNPRKGVVFVAPVTVANFASLDTTGMTWTPLYNSDDTWSQGAFNNAAGSSNTDFGFGSYNGATHNVDASRVFVVRSGSAGSYTCTKLYIDLKSTQGKYVLTYDNLNNTNLQTQDISVAPYATKNFVYYSMTDNLIVDREPAKNSWDLLFTQYTSSTEPYSGLYDQTVTGVLANLGIEIAQVNEVDQSTYEDYSDLDFSENTNTIGWDWKKLVYTATPPWQISTDVVYFVKVSNGDIWKVYFTGFSGGSTGTYSFTKEKLSTVTGLFNSTEKASLSVYPNPTANGNATVIYDFANSKDAALTVCDLTGNVLFNENIQSGLNAYTFSTASLKTGLYLVTLNVNGTVLQQKLMVK